MVMHAGSAARRPSAARGRRGIVIPVRESAPVRESLLAFGAASTYIHETDFLKKAALTDHDHDG